VNYLTVIEPLSELVNAGLCVPLATPVTLNEPLNFKVPVAPANFPVPLVMVAVPLSVTVPGPLSGPEPEEVATFRLSVLPPPARTPVPLNLNPVLVDVVGTLPVPDRVLAPSVVPVPEPLIDVTLADADVELFTISAVSVPEYLPVKVIFFVAAFFDAWTAVACGTADRTVAAPDGAHTPAAAMSATTPIADAFCAMPTALVLL
jgi:hypothetical protein